METLKENGTTLVKYSVIVPVFCNEGIITTTCTELYEKVFKHNPHGELIFVDDGSLDHSFAKLLEIKQHYSFVRVIKLTRNFGQASAILAGCTYAKGECIIVISADLQDPPELMNDMLRYHFEDHYEIVLGYRDSREESFFRKVTSQIFYQLVKTLSFQNMPKGGFDYYLISSQVKNFILNNREHNTFLQGQILWTGFSTKFIPYHRKKREIGKSQWTLSKKMTTFIDGIMNYSYAPLRVMSFLGAGVALSGFLYAICIVFARIFNNVPFKGWAPLMILILVLSGIQMIMLGVIGEYLWRTLDQVRNRDLYIIEQIYD